MKNITLEVQGMSCEHCVKKIEGNVGQLKGVNQVIVKLDSAQVDVSFIETETPLDKIKETIEDLGYDVN